MISALVGIFADHLLREFKSRLSFLSPYFRNVMIGMMLILCSFIVWAAGIILIFMALFFHLAHLPQYICPSLLTALAGFVFAGCVTGLGVFLVVKPIRFH